MNCILSCRFKQGTVNYWFCISKTCPTTTPMWCVIEPSRATVRTRSTQVNAHLLYYENVMRDLCSRGATRKIWTRSSYSRVKRSILSLPTRKMCYYCHCSMRYCTHFFRTSVEGPSSNQQSTQRLSNDTVGKTEYKQTRYADRVAFWVFRSMRHPASHFGASVITDRFAVDCLWRVCIRYTSQPSIENEINSLVVAKRAWMCMCACHPAKKVYS